VPHFDTSFIRQQSSQDTYAAEEAAMLFDLSNDIYVIQQLSKHQRCFVAYLEPLCLQHNLLLTFGSTQLTSHLPLLNTNT